MKNIFLLTLLLSALSFYVSAGKKGYFDGYIVTIDGDTLKGQIKDRDPAPFASLYEKVRFIEKGKKRSKKYAPDKILAYGYEGMNFRSVKLEERTERLKIRYYIRSSAESIFLKVIKETEFLIHYEQEFFHDDNDFLDAYPLFQIVGRNEMVRVTQGILGLKKKRLSEYFTDCGALVAQLNAGRFETLDDLYDYYHNSCTSEE